MLEEYLCKKYHCTKEQLHSNKNHLILVESSIPFMKVVAYQNTTLLLTSHHYYSLLTELIENKNRDELFELPFVYGHTLHFVYKSKKTQSVSFSYELITKNFDEFTGFTNAIDEKTEIVCVVKSEGKVIGVAGASRLDDHIYELGVDVVKEFRNLGIASQIVQVLSEKLNNDQKICIYSSSITNIASQNVAIKSGYQLVWVDTFGTAKDEYDSYKKIRG